MLKQLRVEFPDLPMKVIWDGASYHRAKTVQIAADEVFDIALQPLPTYNPDFMRSSIFGSGCGRRPLITLVMTAKRI